MAAKKIVNDSQRQIRLPAELAQEADAVFGKLNMSFSEAVRVFLEESVKAGRLPFRPTLSIEAKNWMQSRKMEKEYIDSVLHLSNETPAARLLKSIFGENSGASMSDEQLQEWALFTGLPPALKPGTLEDLYDSGLFSQDPWSGDAQMVDDYDDSKDADPISHALLVLYQTQNIRNNLNKAHQTMLTNAINAYVNADSEKFKAEIEEARNAH